jgi:hypothetical protein
MNTKFFKFLALTIGLLAVSAAFVGAQEKKDDGKCPCDKDKPKAIDACDKDKKCCPSDKDKPKAFVALDEPKKDGVCPCDKDKPKA